MTDSPIDPRLTASVTSQNKQGEVSPTLSLHHGHFRLKNPISAHVFYRYGCNRAPGQTLPFQDAAISNSYTIDPDPREGSRDCHPYTYNQGADYRELVSTELSKQQSRSPD